MHKLLHILILPVLLFTGWAIVRLFADITTAPEQPQPPPVKEMYSERRRQTPIPADTALADSRGPVKTLVFPQALPEAPDKHGLLRRTFASDAPESLRQALLNVGAKRLIVGENGAYTASLTPNALSILEKRRLSVLPARLPLTQALRTAIETAHPDDRFRLTFLCTDDDARDMLTAALKGRGLTEVVADLAVVSQISVQHLGEVLREVGIGVAALGLRREGILFGDTAPDSCPVLRTPPLPFTGRGERLAVFDTGCSSGKQGLHTDTFHADLAAVTNILPQPWWALISKGIPTDGTDTHGHGTHVAGILAGSGKASPGRRLRGWAPAAHLFVQNNTFAGNFLRLPPDIRSVFAEAYAHGVRIHSNSWGTREGGDSAYGLSAWAADNFVWEHPDFLPIFAAGNSGPHPHTLSGGAALGKNVLTVGALDHAGSLPATFSSRGPTADNRPKPELYADGERIIAPSSNAPRGYAVLSGTSMATPAVAGMLAQLRQWLRENRGIDAPSSALLRALLIAGATPFPESIRPHNPNEPQPPPETFGIANIRRSIIPDSAYPLFAEWTYGATGSVYKVPFCQAVTGPLNITLSWIDAPADIGAHTTDVNRLALRLLDSNDTLLHTFEPLPGNNRRVQLDSLPAGSYTLCIDAHSVPLPGSKAAVVLQLPHPSASHLIHAPFVRINPGTSLPLNTEAVGPLRHTLCLETSPNGTDYTVADRTDRLDAPSHPGQFFYRFTSDDTVLCGPFAITVGTPVTLTVTTNQHAFPCEPICGTSERAVGEPILATAGPAWTWQVIHTDTPTISRISTPVSGWTLTDSASGRRLLSGEGYVAKFTMPSTPATLTWH